MTRINREIVRNGQAYTENLVNRIRYRGSKKD